MGGTKLQLHLLAGYTLRYVLFIVYSTKYVLFVVSQYLESMTSCHRTSFLSVLSVTEFYKLKYITLWYRCVEFLTMDVGRKKVLD